MPRFMDSVRVPKFLIGNYVEAWNDEPFCEWVKSVALAVEDTGDADERKKVQSFCKAIRYRIRLRREFFKKRKEEPVGGELGACSARRSLHPHLDADRGYYYLWKDEVG